MNAQDIARICDADVATSPDARRKGRPGRADVTVGELIEAQRRLEGVAQVAA